jgi:hypothetical protein
MFKLQGERERDEAEIGAAEFENRSDADVREDGTVGGSDGMATDGGDGRSPFVCNA